MIRLACSSWSLHASLGGARYTHDETGRPTAGGPEREPRLHLAELPARLAERGIGVLELVHFHLPDATAAGLAELRVAIEAAGVELATVLVDTGDLAHPDPDRRARDRDELVRWIERAARLGSRSVRIIPGQQDPADPVTIERAIAGLRELAAVAAEHGLHCRTENFLRTGEDADALLAILEACGEEVSVCLDLGNAEAFADKDADLARLAPRATAIHAKARYHAGEPDADELQRSLRAAMPADFAGHVSLIHGAGEEWADLERLAGIVRAVV